MSWLARSLTNSLRLDDDGEADADADADADGDEEYEVVPNHSHNPPSTSPRSHEPHCLQHHHQQQQPQQKELGSENEAQARGAQEDLNVFKQTITRQFRGMASFLAPPPADSHPSSTSDHRTQSNPPAFTYNQSEPSDQCVSENGEKVEAQQIRRGFSDIQEGCFRRGAPETSGTEPNFISFGSDLVGNEESETEECDIERAVGITDEVLAFARNIAMHPETWLDFPIDEEDDTDDFDLSDAQQEHALAIERLAPRLAALRIELCPCHMSESYFWKVYFVLLHSRLNKQDAGVLLTPQVMAARAMWMQELQKQVKLQSEWFDDLHYGTYRFESTTFSPKADNETEKHTFESAETHFVDKSVIEESPIIKTDNKDLISGRSSKIILQDYEDDEDDWPEEDSELGGYDGTTIPVVNEEDISFSDLEDDDYSVEHVKSNTDSRAV